MITFEEKYETAIQNAFAKMQPNIEDDVDTLAFNIKQRVINRLNSTLTDDQELLILLSAKETALFCDTICKAYVHTALTEILPILKKEFLKDV